MLQLGLLAQSLSAEWERLSVEGGKPQTSIDFANLADLHERAVAALRLFVECTGIDLQATQPIVSVEAQLAELENERAMLTRLPELHRVEEAVRARGLGPVLEDSISRGLQAEDAAAALEHVWLASILDKLSVEQPALAAFDGRTQDAARREFSMADRTHIDVAKHRVRRAWAERAVQVRDELPDQAAAVSRQAALKRRHMAVRDLFDRAPDVMTAVKPCWVMSPLVVAQVLPARQCFDVVVFDEASQIPPADAASSLLRGRQAIVAGDPHQLPPTTFFSSEVEEDEGSDQTSTDLSEEDQEVVAAGLELALTSDHESVLDVMLALLPPPHGTRVLSWHYRSRDERLITFSNAQESLYDWSMTTFPGALSGDPLRHVLVPFRLGAPRVSASAPAEVERVVELVLEHARTRPDESLGVIALGSPHADAITEALRLARGEHPELEQFFAEEQDEPLFVKNLERVQGDERDAIILTVGYGRTVDGRMRYQFGPLTQRGGERRLNVAITRARRRMTVVSSFSGEEMDPERLHSVGSQMLRDYLLYAASGGTNLGLRARTKPALNPFERDVLEQLERGGVPLIPQYGASGYWIDFAAMHPERRSEPVLAIEADGASYHSSPSARDRDRLRQEHLERLGWQFHRIWSTDWFRHREEEVERALAAFQQAVKSRDNEASNESGIEAETAEQQQPDWMPESTDAIAGRDPWPLVRRGSPISDYTQRQLRAVVRWVRSDGRLYTEEKLLAEVVDALGFRRRGHRIVEAIQRAIAAERAEV